MRRIPVNIGMYVIGGILGVMLLEMFYQVVEMTTAYHVIG